jgi:hypothetical protein
MASFDVITIGSLNITPHVALPLAVSVQSQKRLDAMQQQFSAAQDAVSYSVAAGMTLA